MEPMKMEKIEEVTPIPGVDIKMTVDVFDGEHLDAAVELQGKFTVEGRVRKEFCKELGELVDAYRI